MLALGATACGEGESLPPEAPENVETQVEQAPLNGQMNFLFSGCSAAEEATIRAAMSYAVDMLYNRSGDYLACLKNAFMFPNEGRTPEYILRRLKDNMSTNMKCSDSCDGATNWQACAPVEVSNEQMTWNRTYLASGYAVSDYAGTLVHEIAHNKGFRHPMAATMADYDFTVNEQVESCMEDLTTNWASRDLLQGETELAHVGHNDGNWVDITSSSGGYLRSATVGIGLSSPFTPGDVMRNLSLTWQDVGSSVSTTLGVGNSSYVHTTGTAACASHEVVTGIYGYTDNGVEQLGLFCSPITDVQATIFSRRAVFAAGNVKGDYFERQCPAGMAVHRVTGRTDANIDQLRVACKRLDVSSTVTLQTRLGSPDGGRDQRRCVGLGAMVGLVGRQGGRVDALGGICQSLNVDSLGQVVLGGGSTTHLLATSGGGGGTEFTTRCPAGTALVGLNMREGLAIDSVQGVCAPVSKWHDLSQTILSTDYRTLTAQGGSGGSAYQLRCQRGWFLAGLDLTVQDTVESLAMLCRRR